MLPETYRMLAARQDSYWWHRARRSMSRALLRRHGLPARLRWLDLGCGPGGNLHMLEALSPALVAGLDLSPLALELAQRAAPDAALLRGDISRGLPFADGSFDLVTVFNVLCHSWVASELAVLREITRVLRPGGLLLATEPAFAALFRDMDVAAMATRRYRCSGFASLCRAAGFDVRFATYFASFGFPILLLLKAASRLRALGRGAIKAPAADMKPLNHVVNGLLYRVAALEAWAIGRGAHMPFGTTLVCVARKRQPGASP
jgi:SAM-dependent methyltransferase